MKLTDTQLVILTRAAQRDDAAAEIPDNLKGGAAQKVVAKLLREGLLEEGPAAPGMPVWRQDEEKGAIALLVTPAGLEDLGIDPPQHRDPEPFPAPAAALHCGSEQLPESSEDGPSRSPQGPREGSKLAVVVELLQREAGASVADLTSATGWLPHTTRAALTGLRKRGYTISKAQKQDGPTTYRISPYAALPVAAPLASEVA